MPNDKSLVTSSYVVSDFEMDKVLLMRYAPFAMLQEYKRSVSQVSQKTSRIAISLQVFTGGGNRSCEFEKLLLTGVKPDTFIIPAKNSSKEQNAR